MKSKFITLGRIAIASCLISGFIIYSTHFASSLNLKQNKSHAHPKVITQSQPKLAAVVRLPASSPNIQTVQNFSISQKNPENDDPPEMSPEIRRFKQSILLLAREEKVARLLEVSNKNDFLTRAAIKEMSLIQDERLVENLQNQIRNPNISIATAAAEALVKLKGEEVTPLFIQVLSEVETRNDGLENDLASLLVQAIGDFEAPGDSEALLLEVQRIQKQPFDYLFTRNLINALLKKSDTVSLRALHYLTVFLERKVLPAISPQNEEYNKMVRNLIHDTKLNEPEI